jgi:hypothetical protein
MQSHDAWLCARSRQKSAPAAAGLQIMTVPGGGVSMRVQGKVATWLDMVAATHFHHAPVEARLHPISGDQPESLDPENQCYAISVDGRWLCSGNGRITVLRGLKSARRFLDLLKLNGYQPGEPAEFAIDCATSAHCMALDKRRGLRNCTQLLQDRPI